LRELNETELPPINGNFDFIVKRYNMKILNPCLPVALLLLIFFSCKPSHNQSNESQPAENQEQAAELYDPTGIAAENAQLMKLGEGYRFTEGPAVDQNGNVFFTDQPNDQIIKWDANTHELSVFLEDTGRANGMYFDAEGNLITCADLSGEIRSIDASGTQRVILPHDKNKRLNGPNDLWIAPGGGMYITDPLYKREYWTADDARTVAPLPEGRHLYYLGPDRKSLRVVDDNLVQPNGVVGTPDGKKLYVADIDDAKTYVYTIEVDGSLTNRQLFCEMKSDGMTIDNQGNVYLTNNLGVTGFNSQGERIFNVRTGENWTANVVFGGADKDMLFITAMGSVYGLPMKVRGVQ
jgi:gluconolactonase